MRTLLLFLALGLLAFGFREGNFTIRFEPRAMLQTDAEIPFKITVTDDLRKPLYNAKVTLQIETKDHRNVKVFKAPQTEQGVYLAKPIFTEPGDWTVSVEAVRNDESSARTLDFVIPK